MDKIDNSKIAWIVSSKSARISETPAIRVSSTLLSFNIAAVALLKGKRTFLLGYDSNHIYLKPAESDDFGFKVHQVNKKPGRTPYTHICAKGFISKLNLTIPTSIILREQNGMIVGDIPKKEK